MKRIAAAVAGKTIKEAADIVTKTASEVRKNVEENVTMSRKTFMLEIAVALLGGIVLGMFLSPRKKVTYKIASNNRINSEDDQDEEEECYDEDSGDEDKDDGKSGKFIKL